jgi:hypothetical protein
LRLHRTIFSFFKIWNTLHKKTNSAIRSSSNCTTLTSAYAPDSWLFVKCVCKPSCACVVRVCCVLVWYYSPSCYRSTVTSCPSCS